MADYYIIYDKNSNRYVTTIGRDKLGWKKDINLATQFLHKDALNLCDELEAAEKSLNLELKEYV